MTKNTFFQKISSHWIWIALIAIIDFFTIAFRYAMPIRDGDIWWHMLYGQYFIENNTLIADHTIFSWSPSSNNLLYCTWLPDIIFYYIFKIFGLAGLFGIRYFCFFLIISLALFLSKKCGNLRNPIIWFSILLFALIAYTAAYVKPEIISFLFLSILVFNFFCIKINEDNNWKLLYFFPVIMLLWVNSHGGFIFGVIFLLLVSGGEVLNFIFNYENSFSKETIKHLVISLFLVVAVLMITPYGVDYQIQILKDIIPTSSNLAYNSKVAAYTPTFLFSLEAHDFALYANISAFIITLLLLLFFIYNRFVDWSVILINLFFSFIYSIYFRTTFYFAPVFLFSVIYLLRDNFLVSPSLERRIRKFSLLFLVAALLISSHAIYRSYFFPEIDNWTGSFGISYLNSKEEVEFIKTNFANEKIGNTYDQGGYLLWKLWPDNKVFFDQRHFPYKAWSDEFFSFLNGYDFDNFLEKYPATVWLVGHKYFSLSLLFSQSDEWRLVFYGKNAAVFVSTKLNLPETWNVLPLHDKNLYSFKNPFSAYRLFIFALNMQQWDVAEKMLDVINNDFHETTREKVFDNCEFMLTGMRAFVNHDYELAVKSFSEIRSEYFKSTIPLAISYLRLSQKALKGGDLAAAAKYIHYFSILLPENIYTYYNTGIIEWHLHKNNLPGATMINGSPAWCYYLQLFLDNAENISMFKSYVMHAKRLLGNDPNLIDPQMATLLLEPDIGIWSK